MKKDQRITGANLAHGAAYQPFLETHHVSSRGIASRIPGWKTGRVHHLLSKLENQFFYLLEWSEGVTDIREQFALPLDKTQEIADQLGVAHPKQAPTTIPMVMTTDFLVTLTSRKQLAITVKPSEELGRKRILEKFEIERLYWKEQETEWRIATEKDLPVALVENIEWIHPAQNPHPPDLTKSAEELLLRLLSEGKSLVGATASADKALNLQAGNSLTLVRHFLATRRWKTDMTKKINPSQPLRITRG